MVAIPLLSGIQGSRGAEFTTAYPINLEPVPVKSGLSEGQFRMTAGAIPCATGPGADRGGTLWNGVVYRVMGSSLVRVDTNLSVSVIGSVGGTGPVRFDYSFSHLGIHSGTALYLFDGTSLSQVNDVDLGVVKDALWVDGYWMTTDGTHMVVTELSNPFEVKPLKYGSAEDDPDMIVGLVKTRGEVHAIGRHSIQPQRNVGGSGFPFATVRNATIPYGCVSATAKTEFGDTYAFVGSKRNEALSVLLGGQSDATKISTREVDDALAAEPDKEAIVLESRQYRNERRLYVHLSTETWVFLSAATARAGEPMWHRAQSAAGQPYRIRNAVEWNGRHLVGDRDTSTLAWLADDVSSHFGDPAQWEFQTGFVYNGGSGGLLKSVELVGLPGRVPAEEEATAFMSMTRDGVTWSIERAISMGRAGERTKRLEWRPRTRFANYIGLRFRGYNRAMPGFARLEADIEALGA